MDSSNRNSDIALKVRNFIRKKSRILSCYPGFHKREREDLEQDLLLDLLQRLEKFDPSRSPKDAFCFLVVKRRFATLLQQRNAKKRGRGYRHVSLNHSLRHDDDMRGDLGETIDQENYFRRTRGVYSATEERQDLQIDVRRAMQLLPPDLLHIAKLLQRMGPTKIEETTGIARATVYEARSRIRGIFEDAGLIIYLRWRPEPEEG